MFELGPPCVNLRGVKVQWIGLWISPWLKLECGKSRRGELSLFKEVCG